MLCLEQEVDQLSMSPAKTSLVTSATSGGQTQTTAATTATVKSPSSPGGIGPNGDMDVGYMGGGFLDGLLGCLRPVWGIIGKATNAELKSTQSKI